MKAFIDLKLEPGIYRNREIESGVLENLHLIYINYRFE